MFNYLIMEDFAGQPAPFLFPEKVAHADMRDQLPYGAIISGGQIAIIDGELVCSGGCAELGLHARTDDAHIIGAAFAGAVDHA